MSEKEMHEAPRCEHVRLSGRRCKAPAKRGGNYCLFHEHEHDTSPNLTFPPVEDAASVQVAADQVLQALRDDTIEFPRASLMLSGLRLMRASLRQLAAEMGQDDALPRSRQKNDEEDLPGPSFAEILIDRLHNLEVEEAREQGLPEPPPIDLKGKSAGEAFLEHLQLVDPEESPPEDQPPASND